MAGVFSLRTQDSIHQKESLAHYAPKLRIHTSYKPSARYREYIGARRYGIFLRVFNSIAHEWDASGKSSSCRFSFSAAKNANIKGTE